MLFRVFLWTTLGPRLSFAFLRSRPFSVRKSAMTTSQNMAYEVEEKFQLSEASKVESRLKELGFVPKKQAEFVDWYFDTEKNELSLQDCWLRFRGTSNVDGDWELKKAHGESTSTTVYEEIAGEEAISATKTILVERGCNIGEQRADDDNNFEAPPLPNFASDLPLRAFCRLETKRSSWQLDKEWSTQTHAGLSVDLDVTNTGYSVGEVEMVVDDKDKIKDANKRVQLLIAELTKGSAPCEGPATGKLEQFLMIHRPNHYEDCLEAGVIKRR
ncbi:unnamed protein product [Cylindrotheca closterium]|uniref:CYTH domain-containing protein n=1 Tax=Cylindrotheca closterium TaxID=2856 RepID=A0AAD2CEE5_9STRA|nr:unnamed protein product [Cylindrotheca closterium]